LWDTAGIHDSNDQVERLGVDRSRSHLERADAAIIVFDGSAAFTDDDRQLIEVVQRKKHLNIINKNDLPRQLVIDEIGARSESEPIFVSARYGDGIGSLKFALRELLLDYKVEPPVAVTNNRHKSELLRSTDALSQAMTTLSDKLAPEMAAVDLNQAREALEEIIGVVNNDNILERIFANFCVGK